MLTYSIQAFSRHGCGLITVLLKNDLVSHVICQVLPRRNFHDEPGDGDAMERYSPRFLRCVAAILGNISGTSSGRSAAVMANVDVLASLAELLKCDDPLGNGLSQLWG